MKRLTIALAAITISILASFGAASAAHGSPWEFAGAYQSDAECISAGEEGLVTGEWQDYVCILFEGQHDLYVHAG